MLREVSNRAALAHRTTFSRGSCAQNMQISHLRALSACPSLPIEAILARTHQHRIPVSTHADAHVSIIKARSEARLGIGRVTMDTNEVQNEQEEDRRADLRRRLAALRCGCQG